MRWLHKAHNVFSPPESHVRVICSGIGITLVLVVLVSCEVVVAWYWLDTDEVVALYW